MIITLHHYGLLFYGFSSAHCRLTDRVMVDRLDLTLRTYVCHEHRCVSLLFDHVLQVNHCVAVGDYQWCRLPLLLRVRILVLEFGLAVDVLDEAILVNSMGPSFTTKSLRVVFRTQNRCHGRRFGTRRCHHNVGVFAMGHSHRCELVV